MTTYPIMVERLSRAQALRIVCRKCGAEDDIDGDDLLNDGLYVCPADTERARRASTEARCRGTAVMKYDEGVKCRNCGRLDWDMPLEGCCSRRCALQIEWGKQIGAIG